MKIILWPVISSQSKSKSGSTHARNSVYLSNTALPANTSKPVNTAMLMFPMGCEREIHI